MSTVTNEAADRLLDDTLTASRLDSLLQALAANSDHAGEAYEALRWKLVKFFEWSCSATAEELADGTLNRLARKIEQSPDEVRDVTGYALGIARMIRHEAYKKGLKAVPFPRSDLEELSDFGASIATLDEKIQHQKELRCLEECLERLSAEDRSIFLAYRIGGGHDTENRRSIARRLGMSPGALRVRINRLREKLAKWMVEHLRS